MARRGCDRLRVLLLSGYDAASHRHWRESLQRHLPEFDWRVVSLPDRHFYWRVRGNPLTFAYRHREELLAPADLLVATSMVDVATLRGFVPELAQLPTLLYFHENQFAYPTRKPSSNIVNAQLGSIYSALCADRIAFNSEYNRRSFFAGAEALLRKMPDGVPSGLLERQMPVGVVMPVPIEPLGRPAQPRAAGALQIVWNHRWEYDKQPQVFFDAARQLRDAGHDFRLHVMGQSFRTVPECFAEAKVDLGDQITTWGHQPQSRYRQILARADVVVSTALHDFQGLSMLEAISSGCVPLAPDRVAYPEYVPAPLRYRSGSAADEARALYEHLAALCARPDALPAPPCVARYLAPTVVRDYRELLIAMAGR